MNDQTEFEPERAARWAAVLAMAAAGTFALLYLRAGLPALLAPLTGDAPWRLRLVELVLLLGGALGSVVGGLRFQLLAFQRSLARCCRAAAAAAAVALMAQNWVWGLVAAFASGVAAGWLLVVLLSGLRATIGTQGLGAALGLGVGFAHVLAQAPVLLAAEPRMQTVVAALIVATASLASPFLAPQEPSVSPLPEYRPRAVAAGAGLLVLGAAVAAAGAIWVGRRLPEAAENADRAGMFVAAALAPLVAGFATGVALDRRQRRAVGAAVLAALVLAPLAVGAFPTVAGALQLAGLAAFLVLAAEYASRSGRARQVALPVAVALWLGWGLAWALAPLL